MTSRRRLSILDRIERTLMKGSILSIFALGFATLLVVMTASAVVSVLHIHASNNDLSFPDAVWEILQRAIDPGQLANEHDWSSRITLLVVTGIGLLLMSTLISIVNTTIEQRIATTRHGRRPLNIEGHIAVIGWNDLGTKYTEELAEAHQDGEQIHAVVLSDHDPVDLLNLVHEDLSRQKSLSAETQTVKHPEVWLSARRGQVDNTADLLNLARIDSARAAIVLSRDGSDDDTITTILAIIAALQNASSPRPRPLTIVAAFNDSLKGNRLRDRVNMLMEANSASQFRSCQVITVTPELIRSGIGSQVARQRGLSELYRDLIDFDGDEIYFMRPSDPTLTFGDLLEMDGATPIALELNGMVDMWPAWSTTIAEANVVAISHDHRAADAACRSLVKKEVLEASRRGRPAPTTPENFLVIGWNDEASVLIHDLRLTAPTGSTMSLLIDESVGIPPNIQELLDEVIRRTRVSDPLDDESFLSRFEHVIVLSHDGMSDRESDALVLMDILACRGHTDSRDHVGEPMTVVAELRQRGAKHIAGARLADDLLVNDSLAASAATQLAVHPKIWPVLEALFTPGREVVLTSLRSQSTRYEGLTIRQVRQELAGTTGEIPVAIRKNMTVARVLVNPRLNHRIERGDELIVLTKRA